MAVDSAPLPTSPNPFEDPLRFERRLAPVALVIFGANGDLTMRKLLPALYRLAYERRLPAGFAVIGNSRTPLTDDAFRQKMYESVKQFLEDSAFDEDLWQEFARKLYYIAGDVNDPACYAALKTKLTEAMKRKGAWDSLRQELSRSSPT